VVRVSAAAIGRSPIAAALTCSILRFPVRSPYAYKPRTPISLGDKLTLVEIRDAGHTWPQTLAMFRLIISVSPARAIYKNKEKLKRRAAASEDLSGTRQRRSYFKAVS